MLFFMFYIDLYEMIDMDNSEFRLVLVVWDGVSYDNWNILDGFYMVVNILSF